MRKKRVVKVKCKRGSKRKTCNVLRSYDRCN